MKRNFTSAELRREHFLQGFTEDFGKTCDILGTRLTIGDKVVIVNEYNIYEGEITAFFYYELDDTNYYEVESIGVDGDEINLTDIDLIGILC